MNLQQIKNDVGYRVKLVPQAYHLDAAGDAMAFCDEDWTIMLVTDDYVEVTAPSGHFYRLGKDHVVSFYTDPHRSTDGLRHGFLQLKVQLYIQGREVKALPNHIPGAPVPPPVNLGLKARAAFVPDVERVFRRQVQILDRVIANFITTGADLLGKQHTVRPNDTWESLKPTQSRLYPASALVCDLSAGDSQVIAEFYSAVGEVADLIENWSGAVPLTEYNAWNVLMHKVQNSLHLGEVVVQKFCPDRRFDATLPASGTMLARSQHSLQGAESARKSFTEQYEAMLARRSPKPARRR